MLRPETVRVQRELRKGAEIRKGKEKNLRESRVQSGTLDEMRGKEPKETASPLLGQARPRTLPMTATLEMAQNKRCSVGKKGKRCGKV